MKIKDFIHHRYTFILLACILASPSSSDAKKFIIKVKENHSRQFFAQSVMRAYNTRHLSQEISSNISGLRKVHSLEKVGMVLVHTDNDEELQTALKSMQNVEYVEEALPIKATSTTTAINPSDSTHAGWLNDILGVNNSSAPSMTVSVPADCNSNSHCTTVAVVDSGLDTSHSYFTGASNFLIAGCNEVNGNGTCSSSNVSDGNGHGTHVASLVKVVRDAAYGIGASYQNAKYVRVVPIKFLDDSASGDTADAVYGLDDAATKGAKVINMSWGGTDYSNSLFDAVSTLYTNDDIVFVAEAGNSTSNNDNTPFFPSSFGLNVPSFISVASGTYNNTTSISLSSFSNYGKHTVDVIAPGSISSIWGLWGACAAGSTWDGTSPVCSSLSTNTFITAQGTSMASPVIAGVAAVMRALNPALKAYQIKDLITGSTAQNGSLGTMRYGIIQAKSAFDAAISATAASSSPGVGSTAYDAYSSNPSQSSAPASGGKGSSSGGCATISQVGIDQEGPLGGNSLGLFSMLYALWYLRTQYLKRKKNSF